MPSAEFLQNGEPGQVAFSTGAILQSVKRRWEGGGKRGAGSLGSRRSRDLGPSVGDGPAQPCTLRIEGPGGLQVALCEGLCVEFCERDAGLEAGVGQGAQLGVGRTDVGSPVDAAVGALALGGEQAGPVVVDVRRQVLLGERVDQRREALRDVVVAEDTAHDAGILALDESVVGVAHVWLVEQRGHGVVDVPGAVVHTE